jgi:hypothetical protein
MGTGVLSLTELRCCTCKQPADNPRSGSGHDRQPLSRALGQDNEDRRVPAGLCGDLDRHPSGPLWEIPPSPAGGVEEPESFGCDPTSIMSLASLSIPTPPSTSKSPICQPEPESVDRSSIPGVPSTRRRECSLSDRSRLPVTYPPHHIRAVTLAV